MKIERYPDKCVILPDVNAVDRVTVLYDTEQCTVSFRDGEERTFRHEWEIHHAAYYGVSFSPDGKIMYTGSWYNGVFALDSRSGAVVWHWKCTKVRELFVCSSSVIAMRHCDSLCKLDLLTGIVIDKVTGRSLESCWQLNDHLVLLNSKYGKLCVLNTDTMTIVQKIARSVYDPKLCLSQIIQEARLRDNAIVISGVEEYPKGQDLFEQASFERCIGCVEAETK